MHVANRAVMSLKFLLAPENKGKKPMEGQVKSKIRFSDHGGVLTGKREVNAMLDMVKQESERIESRFLKPVYNFKRYKDSSMSFTGINKHEGVDINLYDTVITRKDAQVVFENASVPAKDGLRK